MNEVTRQDIDELRRRLSLIEFSNQGASLRQPFIHMGSSLASSLMMGGLNPSLGDFNHITTTEFQSQVFSNAAKTQLGLTIVPDGLPQNGGNVLGFFNSLAAGTYSCGMIAQSFGVIPAPHILIFITGGGSANSGLALLNTTGTQYPVVVGAGSVASSSGNGVLQVAGDTQKLWAARRTPASSAATGVLGEICFDDSYVYVYTSAGWKRTALAAF